MGESDSMNIAEKKKCTGCKMCADICPRKAIIFRTDKAGFWYPQIDEEKCINCGLCLERCPAVNDKSTAPKNIPEVYAAWSKDFRTRECSTSGGIFWEISKSFIEGGGVVAGARWGTDWKSAVHYIAENLEELCYLRGSKYIQSDTGNIYIKVKEKLEKGIKVLFCGTPCQNAALKSYLNEQYKGIFYLDFICRSINSPKALAAYITELEDKYKSNVVSLQQKNKDKGWKSLATKVIFENGEVFLRDRDTDAWVQGFIRGDLYTRENCFDCQYRTLPRRTSDITVGDFWGIKETEYDMFRGISAVIINTENGKALWENAKNNLFVRKKSIKDLVGGQFALLKNPPNANKREEFFRLLETKKFSECVSALNGVNKSIEKDMYQELEEDIKRYQMRGTINKEQYLYLNFDCPNIIHKGKGKIIPYQNVILDLKPYAQITILGDRDFELGTNLFVGSRAETLVRLENGAEWKIKNGGYLFYGTTLDIKPNACFETGYFSANTDSVLVIAKKVTLGEDVMIGRNVTIYDSDFHQMVDEDGNQINNPLEVKIDDHVWLTANINVNKGVHIGQGSIVVSQTVISKDIPAYSMVAGQSAGRIIKNDICWSRKPVKKYEKEYASKKIILYGYGVTGKAFEEKHASKIAYIIDNYVNDDKVMNFEQFQQMFLTDDIEQYMWVIASLNHGAEIASQIRRYYSNMLIISVKDL